MALEIRLTGWQNHKEVSLATRKPVAIVAGPNACGKTGLLNAVEFAFLGTGKLRGIDTKKALAELSIHDDATTAEVLVRIPGTSLEIHRTMNRDAKQTVSIRGASFDVTRGDAKIRELLGIEPERVRAALESEHALTGDEDRRRWIFFKATGAVATLGEIMAPLKETGLAEETCSRLAREVLAEGFLQAAKTAATERAAAGRRRDEAAGFELDPLFAPPWRTGEKADFYIDLREASLEVLSDRREELETAISAAEVAEAEDRGRLGAELSAAKARRSALFAERDRAQDYPESYSVVEATLAEARTALEVLEEELRSARARLAAFRLEIRGASEGKLEAPELCPVIPGRPSCPMTKTKLEAFRKGLAKRRSELMRAIAGEEEAIASLKERRAQALAGRDSAEADLEDKQAREKRLEEIAGKLETAEANVAAAIERYQSASGEHPVTKGPDAAELRGRLENLRTLIAVKQSYEKTRAVLASTAEVRTKAAAEREAWDRAAKLLAPDGLPCRLFAARAGELQGYVDELKLESPIRLTAAAELEAEIGNRWRRWAQLSETWRLRLSLVASHALARAAGFPFLIVDRFDHFDPAGRVNILQSLRRVAKHYPGGVLILSTLGRPDPQPTGLPDVETFVLGSLGLRAIG